jgi:CBS domain-containing protein
MASDRAGGRLAQQSRGALLRTTVGYQRITIASVMHRGVVTCGPETPLTGVARMMAGHRIHSVVVWSEADEEGTLWGVVSDLDLVRAIGAGEAESTARAVASTPVVTVEPHESVRHGAQLMIDHGVAHLVVVNHGRPVGVISALDLARMVADTAGA